MPDLTLQSVADNLPAGAMTEASGDVTISLAALTGDSPVALTDEKISEVVTKLLSACSEAQAAYNAANEENLTGFPAPNLGVPTADGSGNLFSRRTHNVSVSIPLSVDEATGA